MVRTKSKSEQNAATAREPAYQYDARLPVELIGVELCSQGYILWIPNPFVHIIDVYCLQMVCLNDLEVLHAYGITRMRYKPHCNTPVEGAKWSDDFDHNTIISGP